jgi:hypothetical protein
MKEGSCAKGMKVFIWRHNRKFHSWSMINEPIINQACYTDAVLVVQAESIEQAYQIVSKQAEGWIVEELKRLEPRILETGNPTIIFADIRSE